VNDLLRALARFDIPYFTSTPVTGIEPADDGMVVGVGSAQGDRGVGNAEIRARKVMLACNGFGANRSMLGRYIPEIADAAYYGCPGNTGEGITWGLALGAGTATMRAYQGYGAVSRPEGIEPSAATLVSWTLIEHGGVMVDRQGLRFGDESIGYSAFAHVVQTKADGVSYLLASQRIMEPVRQTEQRFRLLLERPGSPIHLVDTLEQAAAAAGIPAEALARTVAEYNEAAKSGGDGFGRVNFGLAPLEPPFMIVETHPALFHTQGGLTINENAQVVQPDGTIVPNLYAGGGVAAGISGASSSGYCSGNGLLSALGWGRIAGAHAGAAAVSEAMA
jgi:fumarate reductase flavoprotein subunit